MFKSSTKKQVFNIGTSEEVSISDLADKITKIVGIENKALWGELPVGGTIRRLPDISKLLSLGFKQAVSLDQGLDDYYKHINEYNLDYGKNND
jgi:UDP-glucose 4-epimerase